MTGLLIAGTSSDAGKSLVTAGLCRVFARRGIDVVPFKAQNMSNNSMVVADGEIGRAQYLQAIAAGVEPRTVMNPVLIKPGTDRRAHVVLRGRADGVLEAGQYATGRAHLASAAWAAYRELEATHELVLVEGAGSPAEINLRANDYVNMGLARQFGLPVVLVGDIDRGGVLASIFGTWGLLDEADRAHLAGYVINKFRGDPEVLAPGLDELTRRCGLPCLGVLNWLTDVWLDGEDALAIGGWAGESSERPLRVAVVRLPRVSNATDVDALAAEPGVRVEVTADARVCAEADVLVIPGTRSTTGDLAWLRSRGIDRAVASRHAEGRPTLGICGGYQMLAHRIDDVDEVEGEVSAQGLGLLPVDVEFGADKVLDRPLGSWRGHAVTGYEIHHGVMVPQSNVTAEAFLDGFRVGQTWGTLWHGAFECDDLRRAWLAKAAEAIGHPWRPSDDAPGYAERREQMIDTLADAIESSLDVDALLAMARRGI